MASFRVGLAWTSWWLVMGGFLAVTAWLAHGEAPSPQLVSGMIIANTLFLVVAEQVLPRVPGTNLFRDRQAVNDVAHGVLFQFGGRPVAQALGAGLLTWLAGQTAGASHAWPHHWPFFSQLVAALLLWSFLSYWFHRSLHVFDRLWWFHAVHHDTRQMHLMKSGRIHVGEEFLQYLIVPVPFLLLGVGPDVMAWLALWNVYDGNIVHANLDQRFPDFFHWFFPSVQNHYLHHAEPRVLQDSNYGQFPFWDVLFGTFRHPVANPVPATGIAGDPVPRGFLAQVLYPFRSQLRSSAPQTPDGGR